MKLLILLTLIFSCSKESPTVPKEETKYFDLWVKNPHQFTYVITLDYDSIGAISPYSHEKILRQSGKEKS